ncbi:hypothetical protein CFIMG_004055RA [Ceratocystis fimbriata CBS 114723]|uniref:Uncharacterized protein n=1 Tax=Ceratocystis fimbriata CBS 114723 TaxID=1035309 RepID=A0A2C5X2A4_9PEZI|nr:hypothetical protein CFIMG_004055RA [Ceratocystis fimbriata CBS 114723]
MTSKIPSGGTTQNPLLGHLDFDQSATLSSQIESAICDVILQPPISRNFPILPHSRPWPPSLSPPQLPKLYHHIETQEVDHFSWDLQSVSSFTPEDYSQPKTLQESSSSPSLASSSSISNRCSARDVSPTLSRSSGDLTGCGMCPTEDVNLRINEIDNQSVLLQESPTPGDNKNQLLRNERHLDGPVVVLGAQLETPISVPYLLALPSHSTPRPSPLLLELLQFGKPSSKMALHPRFFPFTTASTATPEPANLPVVKLTNIPFNVSRNQIAIFLGHHHRISDNHEPIHITMCRNTGKTMEVFVELEYEDDLTAVCERYKEGQRSNRPIKIGDRAIIVSRSSQKELMHKMFPTAGGIEWEGLCPMPKTPRGSAAFMHRGFRGFISEEEMTMAVRHVEHPLKSPFSRDCPERAFEYLISTLRKYPWRHTHLISISERFNLFKLAFQLLDLLQDRIQSHCYPARLTTTLLRRVIDTILTCPGFTPFMKANIAEIVGLSASQSREYDMPPNAHEWRHQYGLLIKPRTPDDLVE